MICNLAEIIPKYSFLEDKEYNAKQAGVCNLWLPKIVDPKITHKNSEEPKL
jgi:hypothetical protein